jgi:hypothetical protein
MEVLPQLSQRYQAHSRSCPSNGGQKAIQRACCCHCDRPSKIFFNAILPLIIASPSPGTFPFSEVRKMHRPRPDMSQTYKGGGNLQKTNVQYPPIQRKDCQTP